MKKSLIYGATDFSELILDHLRHDDRGPEPVAVVVDRAFLGGRKSFGGLPLIAAEDLAENFPPEDCGVYLTLGYNHMNVGRQAVFERLKAVGYRMLSYLHPTARIETEVVGEGTLALQNVVVDRFSRLGDGNIFQIGVLLAHHATLGDFNFFAPGVCVAGQVRIGSRCFFGANCTVRNGVRVGDRTLVGASAYLDQDSEPGAVVLPARSAVLEGRDSLELKL